MAIVSQVAVAMQAVFGRALDDLARSARVASSDNASSLACRFCGLWS